ncbi:MAG TPA: translation factor GTPase family protein [Pseudonocardia sp.]
MHPIVNLGILAHVDAGKTSLTERLLHLAGVVDEIGSVDDGSTRTDSLALERRRGITIKSAVVSFPLAGVTVNLIDTPGHPDFIAEVERVLGVLDGAVLVVSAVEGVQAQTRILHRTLARLDIPTLILVNKVDRRGARADAVLREIAEKLTPALVPLSEVDREGTRDAVVTALAPGGLAVLAEHDDGLLAAYVQGAPVPPERLRKALVAQTGRALVHPVFLGSAITGAGVEQLATGIGALLPGAPQVVDAPTAATVFKVERGPAGERVAYVRMLAGAVRLRDRLLGDTVTGVDVFADGGLARRPAVRAGEIAQLRGLTGVRVGDAIGPAARPEQHFAPPTLESVVTPRHAADRAALFAALTELAEQDPLINLRRADVDIAVSLYGEVQKEVIAATLAEDYGIDVSFRETTTVCIERVTGAGEAVELIRVPPNPFLATVGLRVEPGERGESMENEFRLGVELGSMPAAFFTAVRDTVAATLRHGPHGWPVTGCVVTMTHSGYAPRQSHAHGTFDKSMSSSGRDFRHLTPLVLVDALREAGTTVCEPVHAFRLEIPADALDAVLPVVAREDGVAQTHDVRGPLAELAGEIPAARVHGLRQLLPALTRGEAVLEARFDHYRPVRGPARTQARPRVDPWNRKEYLLQVDRRVSAR